MARVVVELVGGPLCGNTDVVRIDGPVPAQIGPYRDSGQRIGRLRRRRYDYQPIEPARPRPACLRHPTPRPGCPGYVPAKPP